MGKLLIVGIDGGTWDIAAGAARAGYLPAIESLMTQGCWGELMTTYPPITAAAWSSFMTGCNPGKHGVYDFLVADPSSEEVVDASAIQQPTLWRLLSRAGLRVGAVNVPVTFPPEPVNGVMIAGCLSPSDPDRSAHPVGLIQRLERATGRQWWQCDRKDYRPTRPLEFLDAVEHSNRTVAAFSAQLCHEQEFDVFMVVFDIVDVVSHFFWHYMDTSHPAHDGADQRLRDAVLRAYRTVDELIAQILRVTGRDTDVVLVSDHGFGPVTRMVNLNNFLMDHGYLKLKRNAICRLKRLARQAGMTPATVMAMLERLGLDPLVCRAPKGLRNRVIGTMGGFGDVDWERTVCYSRGHMGQLHFTAHAKADRHRLQTLRQEVVSALRQELRDPHANEPMVTDVLFGDDIYHGPHTAHAPDMFLVMDDWRTIAYPLLSSGPELVIDNIQKNRWANHRMNGMFCAAGPSFRNAGQLRGLSIVDVAPTVLRNQGVLAPRHMDGRVLKEALREGRLADAGREPVCCGQWEPGPARSSDLTEQEQRERRERLRDIGYL